MSEIENPNKLFIIGNGFDLAHGLKTKYEDFLLWYLNTYIRNSDSSYNDGIIKVNFNLKRSDEFVSIQDFKDYISILENISKKNVFEVIHDFFNKLLENISNFKWVDIEQEYYNYLVKLYQESEPSKLFESFINDAQYLNKHFSCIKEYFKIYIIDILDSRFTIKSEIIDHINQALKFNTIGIDGLINNVVFLNFNYTHTIDDYINSVKKNQKYYTFDNINIHGSIDNPDDIIFGYGDEDDSYYEKLERLNNNSVLNHFKSFGYMKNDKYQNISSFIDAMRFDVYILGHSCGISDRVLLSSIFSHPNCNKIQIFYYQKSETENDFFEKTQQISRHFKAGMKNEMRNRIVPFDKSKPLVRYKK